MTPRLSLCCLLAILTACSPGANESADLEAAAGQQALEVDNPGERQRLGEGFLVWESNRTGRWRIWIRDLERGGPRQLTPDEGRRLHCCPHISPDGLQIAYLSLAPDQQGYPLGGAVGSLRLIRVDGSDQRELVPAARTYFENRAVVWRSPTELIFIQADSRTAMIELATGRIDRLTRAPSPETPWLINSQLTWAASGNGSFSAYDPERQQVAVRAPLRGCQPYFTHDGRWGLWVVAPGGPINAIDLESGAAKTLLKKSDQRLPKGLGYLYFPMPSSDGQLLTFAASPDEHEHFTADYEIFVAETDPRTLELLGEPYRLTHHPATDRFPDVFLVPLPLGRHYGEAPFRWTSTPAASDRDRQWSYGDGATSQGPVGDHLFTLPGRYEVIARSGKTLLKGQVVVAPANPPRPLAVSLLGGGRELAVLFDEPIELGELRAVLDSGIDIGNPKLDRQDRRLRLVLGAPIRQSDTLLLSGLQDRAQRPNILPPTRLEVEPPFWPAHRDGLVFLWETGDAPNLLFDPALGTEAATLLTPRGTARFDHHFALRPSGGRFVASSAAAERIASELQATYELSLEAVITPAPSTGRSTATILETSQRGRRNFALDQQGERLVFGIRMQSRGPEAVPTVPLFTLPADRPSHVVVTYSPGLLVAYLDGRQITTDSSIQGGFFHWRTAPLTLGSAWNGNASWTGRLEGVAIYSRALEPEEVAENYLRYRATLDSRATISTWVVRASLSECSAPPSLEQINPYREALSVCEYRIEEILEGGELPTQVRVVRWAVLDGEQLAVETRGASGRLVLSRYGDNPQLESVYLADTLERKPDAPLFYLAD